MEQKVYKRQDRAVSPETAQKISNSLKSYNTTHPRGTAESGSQWSKAIQRGTKNYWAQIPHQKNTEQSGTKIEDIML